MRVPIKFRRVSWFFRTQNKSLRIPCFSCYYSKSKYPIKYPIINNNAPCIVKLSWKLFSRLEKNYNSLSFLLETRETDYLRFKSRGSKQVERGNRATFYDLGNFSRRVFSLVSLLAGLRSWPLKQEQQSLSLRSNYSARRNRFSKDIQSYIALNGRLEREKAKINPRVNMVLQSFFLSNMIPLIKDKNEQR